MSLPAICELSSRRQWVCWRREPRKGKDTKVPYQPDGRPASATSPKTWNEMPTCYSAVVAGKFDGIGYVLTPDDGVVCIDLDHCLRDDRNDGTLKPWAAEIVRKVNSYTERSPGDGMHIWAKATVDFTGRRYQGVEVYNSGRYITVTSDHLEGTPTELCEATDPIEKIVADFPDAILPVPGVEIGFEIDPNAEPPGTKFGAFLLNDKRFKATWEHTRRDLGDDSLSAYDMSLAVQAAYAEWADQEIVNLIIAHRRNQGNPDKGLRSDYLQRTLTRARQATIAKLKDSQAAETHCTGETREIAVDEGLAALSALLALRVDRVVQRGLDPATYMLETEKGNIHIGSAEILLSVNKARARMIAKSEIYLPPMKAKQWERVVALIVQVHEYEEVAEGQRDQEIFTWVDAYLNDHQPEVPEDGKALANLIATHSFPIEWEGKIQVRSADLKRYLFSVMGEKPTNAVLCTRLREAGWFPAQLFQREGQRVYKARVWTRGIGEASDFIKENTKKPA